MSEDDCVITGSGNVFEDLGLPNANALLQIADFCNTVRDADLFAKSLIKLGTVKTPHVSINTEAGEIDFYWEADGSILDLGVTGDGTYSYYARLPEGKELIEDGASIGESLPIEIIETFLKEKQ